MQGRAEAEGRRGVPARPFRLIEVESWPECREVIVEGRVGPEANAEFEACLLRALESDHDWVLFDFDRCEYLDLDAAKQLVVLWQRLSDQRRELLVFGAVGQVRRVLEGIGAFDLDPPPPSRAG